MSFFALSNNNSHFKTRRMRNFGAIASSAAILLMAAPMSALGADSVQPPAETLELADRLSEAFQYVAETLEPSVVSIRARQRVTQPDMGTAVNPFQGTPFEDFFEGENSPFRFGPPQQDGGGREFFREGEGSGFVYSEDGYILTNNHVVQNAEHVEVYFSDDRSYTAEVIGTDPQTDVAVIKIDASGLQPVKLGDSDELRVGQWIVAAGNPFGLSSSITAGIVSATGRTNLEIADYEDFIQTDAAINPGNSGGPLVNLRGEVVGMNTAIFTRSGGNMGIGFAIPINMVKNITDDLIEDGSVERGWLGVVIQNLNEGLARSFGYEGTDGVLIAEVTPGGPADEAGFRQGDIIVRLDDREIHDMEELRLRVAEIDPGSEVEAVIVRDGDRQTLDIEIGEMPSERVAARGEAGEEVESNLGMELQTLTPNMAGRLGLGEAVQGVVVMRIEPYSAAQRAGLRQGDVIVKVGEEPIEDFRAFRSEIRSHDLDKGVRLTINRGGSTLFLFLQSEN